jgi:hypothetical protein
MTKRAIHRRSFTMANGQQMSYTMDQVWKIGEIVERAGARYKVDINGWRKVK